MPLDKQSRRLTQFVIGNQKHQFYRLIYGIFLGPAAFLLLRVSSLDQLFQEKTS